MKDLSAAISILQSLRRVRPALSALIFAGAAASFAADPREPIKIKLAPMPALGQLIPQLAIGLGYFKDEGIDLEIKNVMDYVPDDFYSTQLLNDGTIDAEICWYQRVVFGIGNDQPARAVVLIEDTPHMMISVATRRKGEIRSAVDFKGRTIADSAGFSTKRYLTDTVIKLAGLPPDSYTAAPIELSQKAGLLVEALKAGRVDVVSSMEPLTSAVMASNLLTPLYDLTTAEGTRRALGNIWPSRCLYLAPGYIAAHPDRVQRLVNVFVRTLRFLNTHTVDEIVARLPAGYYDPDMNNDFWVKYKADKKEEIRKGLPCFASGDYSIPPAAAEFVCKVLFSTPFDDSGEGQYRRKAAQSGKVKPADTYDNRFVEKAMKDFN